MKGALIDDCALALRMKTVGPVWLGLTQRVRSLRPYPGIGDIGRMISRSAYAQLKFSPARLFGATLGLALTFLAPVWLALTRARRRRPVGRARARPDDRELHADQPVLRPEPGVGGALAADRRGLYGLYGALGARLSSRARRHVERPGAGAKRGKGRHERASPRECARAADGGEPAVGQDRRRREFSRRVPADRRAVAAHRPRLLRFRPLRRRCRRQPNPFARAKARAARPDGRFAHRQERRRAARRQAARRARRASRDQPARARPAQRVPPRRGQEPLRQLGRADRLLPALGHAGRALHARRPRRERKPLAGQRRHLRRPADQQPSPGLRQRLQSSGPRLHSAGRARGGRRAHGRPGRRQKFAGAAVLPAESRAEKPRAARTRRRAWRRGQGFPSRPGDRRDRRACAQNRGHADRQRSPVRKGEARARAR